MKTFSELAYDAPEAMTFGKAVHPVRCGHALEIGSGQVFPEINFTLPPMIVERSNFTAIARQYQEMVHGILNRLKVLQVPGAVLEFEHAPPMTGEVEIGAEITGQIKKQMQVFHEQHGLKTALRATICDIREQVRPPRMRTGEATAKLFEAFDRNARQGADLLSIESTGGKEVSDRALMEADIPALLFALGVLAPRDMHFLWKEIEGIAASANVVAAGDTACAFANTAMVLADQGYIPNVLAAIVRAMSAVRSLVAFEEGAIGPSKDCAYEGPVIKAITGYPISMEGKSSACAHFSHMGNIAAAVCDLWSNESVQNVRLLSGFAPEVFTEILAYDCRLMNQALSDAGDGHLQKLFVDGDAGKSVHAFIISPAAAHRLAATIVSHPDDFQRTRHAGLTACEMIRQAVEDYRLTLPKREMHWLDRIETELTWCQDEDFTIGEVLPAYNDAIIPSEYGL